MTAVGATIFREDVPDGAADANFGYPKPLMLLKDRRFKANLTTEPDMSEGETRSVLLVWAADRDEAYLPRYQWVVMCARPAFLAQDPGIVQAVVRGCARASLYMVDHPLRAANIIAADLQPSLVS